ncbi:MAG: hypothetical protein WB565_09335 [Acidimicrobiales bacterium]
MDKGETEMVGPDGVERDKPEEDSPEAVTPETDFEDGLDGLEGLEALDRLEAYAVASSNVTETPAMTRKIARSIRPALRPPRLFRPATMWLG